MSSESQLGLFSGPVIPQATSSDDVANRSSPSCEDAAAKPVTVDEAPRPKPVAPANGDLRRTAKTVSNVKPDAEERYLSVQEVARRYSISIQTVWRHTKGNPDFPKPIKILSGSTRWRLSDIVAYEVSRGETGR